MYHIIKILFLLSLSGNLMSNQTTSKELIFIYNAKSGLVNELIDFAHKIVSPQTYECNLCAVTYGTFTMKNRWANYIDSLPIEYVFTYKDKLVSEELKKVKLPSVFFRDGEKFEELISANEINIINDLEDLITVLETRLKERGVDTKKKKEISLSDEEWQKKLTPEEYHILREKGTERPFTGKYDKFYQDGTYKCAGCDTELFTSETKYNSGCGWPAFYESLPNKIEEHLDNSYGMKRVEITCEKCGGHLGHVFNDGPQPTGLRYCVNSASLDFDPKDKE